METLASKLSVNWRWQRLHELSVPDCEQMFALRQRVFIVEQNCPYMDIDGKDGDAVHLLGDLNGELVATLRVFESYTAYDGQASLGRVCTHPEYRKLGIGRQLMSEAMRWMAEHLPHKDIVISAQCYLQNFYQSFGFDAVSEPYLEDDIPHIRMRFPHTRY